MPGGKIRKLIVVAAIGAVIAAVVKALRGEPTPQFSTHPSVTGGPQPDSPPAPAPAPAPAAAEPEASASASTSEPVPPATQADEQTWVAPIDGACPEGYPIKAKLKSGIFHQPGGTAYERTTPDRCYPSAAAAEADGLRPAKR